MRFMAINIQVGYDCKHQLLCSAINPTALHNLRLKLTTFLYSSIKTQRHLLFCYSDDFF